MCRMFASRTRLPSGVAHELLHGSNALRVQSKEHQDGWGLGWYEHGAPRVVHSLSPAHGDAEFEKLSLFVSAPTVVAHVRRASVGKVARENTHPFQRGSWLFSHNGTIPLWDEARPRVEALIAPALLDKVQGETDSERCFLLFLTLLMRRCEPDFAGVEHAAIALAETARLVREASERPGTEPASTNFFATDGRLLVACRHGRTLFISAPEPDAQGRCDYVALSSENPGDPPPGGSRSWRLLPEESLVAVDPELRLSITSMS